jgi:hypothetical protein
MEGFMSEESRKQIDCPSATATGENARIFGMMTGTPEAGRLGYLTEALPVSEKLLALAGSADPAQVFRIAARCVTGGCKHWRDNGCSLAQRIVEGLPVVVNALPACQIRSTCRWFRQEGKEACLRCPQIIRAKPTSSDHEKQIADDD